MKGFLINPADETVTQMDLSGDTSEISKLLGRVPLLCIYPPLKPGHRFVLWLDDEGLLRKADAAAVRDRRL